jgi:hypothetical protein
MSEIGPYGTSQHAGRDGPMTANQLVGDRVGLATGEGVAPGASPAMHSTAPYKPPKKRPPHPGPKGCYGKEGTCGAPAVRGSDLCIFHQPSSRERREPSATT